MNTALTRPGKPTGLLKLFFKSPLFLYRWHLGWLLGHRFLMFTHIGRKSGRRLQTVVEVVKYDPVTQESVIVAGYGTISDWYRNLQAHPAVEVQIGFKRYVPQQRLLTSEETYEILKYYKRKHPFLVRGLFSFVGYPYDGTEAGLQAVNQIVRGVAFRP
ncbi:nitroreductase family deazaflavin-dependent oxidoreductase [Ktedonosporobacter rubrisoli]|uniref:Nitroreductase family deazaflavin-dependent oxidoreductase n=1 Tax=Ktedonosporobacter rubrisoli TaxID=2509675 RepID=A0A4P6JI44_KTERU|nr:nitroreductase family deazaflavin-dependent oxidoreductase [Ktedonosporobacter rubrisoli]QBD74717.1 nitroreductase family deazaflavin-dependent oxidoreductase [Ktedonosporobacter rubrisoli]